MTNWMTQLREAYQKLIEAELLRGKEAVKKQAQLAQQGKPGAIAALARVERVGGFQPPNEKEDITDRVARELLNPPHPTGTTRNPTPVQGRRRAIRGTKKEKEEMAGLEQTARLKAANRKMG